jgi:hypothetical protein
VPRALVAVQGLDAGLAPELVKEESVQVLFDGPHDVERWDVRSRQDAVELEHWAFTGVELPADPAGNAKGENGRAGASDVLALVSVRRGERTVPMHATFELKDGDVVAVAVHTAERDAAHAQLRAGGWIPHEAEVEHEADPAA